MNEEELMALIRKKPGVRKVDERIRRLQEQADQGNVGAMVTLGDCYLNGRYTEANRKRAFHYYLKAANRGDRNGELMVGKFYLNGVEVEPDEEMGIDYIKSAADKGDAEAQFLTFGFYEDRKLRSRGNESLVYLRNAAKQGHAQAQISLGLKLGAEGAKNDRIESVFWLLCAYMHGDNAHEESERAKDLVNDLMGMGLPRETVDELMETIQSDYPQYMENP